MEIQLQKNWFPNFFFKIWRPPNSNSKAQFNLWLLITWIHKQKLPHRNQKIILKLTIKLNEARANLQVTEAVQTSCLVCDGCLNLPIPRAKYLHFSGASSYYFQVQVALVFHYAFSLLCFVVYSVRLASNVFFNNNLVILQLKRNIGLVLRLDYSDRKINKAMNSH